MNWRRTAAAMLAAGMLTAASGLAQNADLTKDEELYSYTLEREWGLPEGVILAIAETESGLDTEAGNGTCEGLMGIHRSFAGHYAKEAGLETYDLYSARDSMTIGAAILHEHLERTDGALGLALMCYNLGAGGAAEKWKNGIYQTWYSRTVTERMEKYTAPPEPDPLEPDPVPMPEEILWTME